MHIQFKLPNVCSTFIEKVYYDPFSDKNDSNRVIFMAQKSIISMFYTSLMYINVMTEIINLIDTKPILYRNQVGECKQISGIEIKATELLEWKRTDG